MPLIQLTRAQVDAAISGLDARFQKAQPNADETNVALDHAGNFHKTLAHNPGSSRVVSGQYTNFVTALNAFRTGGTLSTFDNALPAFSKLSDRLTDPAAGLAQDLIGVDPRLMPFNPAPSVTSEQCAVEMKELYWMSLLRDVHFSDYSSNVTVARAVSDLNVDNGAMNFLGGSDSSPQTLFRGNDIPGPSVGPYLSQFMYRPVLFGAQEISQRQRTVSPGLDYMLEPETFLQVQNGLVAHRAGQDSFDQTKRFIRNGRDLGQYVHVDALYQAYFNALLVLLGIPGTDDSGNPYVQPDIDRMKGFGTFGGPHILSLLTEVATRALKAVWYQKWFVHRRLRPEAYGGLVHFNNPNLHGAITSSAVISDIQQRTGGSRLLPMAFPEGSPTHPAYGAGHATVAGACVTLLKAWFNENTPLLNPVVPNADGTELVPYTGPGATQLTVGGELNKLAANIAIGRNFAGVHWFSDYSESLRLGERVATILLLKESRDYREKFSFEYQSFDRKVVTVKNGLVTVSGDPALEAFYAFHGNLFSIAGEYHQLTV